VGSWKLGVGRGEFEEGSLKREVGSWKQEEEEEEVSWKLEAGRGRRKREW